MNTKRVCELLNVTPKMLRIYEEHELLSPERGENNYREYSDSDLLRLRSVIVLRKLGFSIEDTRQILSSGNSGNKCMDMFYIQLKAVEESIAKLQSVRGELRDKISVFLNEGVDDNLAISLGVEVETSTHMKAGEKTDSHHVDSSWDFDEMARNYLNRFLKADKQYKDSTKKLRELLRHIIRGKSIIDVGCGTCNLWMPLKPCFAGKGKNLAELTAMDKSLPMLMAARENIDFGKMLCGDILDDLDCGETYDIVISSFTLHHIERSMHKVAIDNMLRLCKTGGQLLIAEKSFDSVKAMEAKKHALAAENRRKELSILDTEYPIIKSDFISYLRYLGYRADTEILTEGVTLYSIFVTKAT